jgi:hypothetical protein
LTKLVRRATTVCLLAAAAFAVTVAAPAGASAAKCFGKRATEVGSGQGETIRGTSKKDVIASKGGADKLKGRGGKDRLCGGAGKDKISGGAGKDKAKGGAGKDKLKGGGGNDFLDGGKGRDVTNGGPGVDTCVNAEVVRNCENQDPALHFDDQIDWGFSNDYTNTDVGPSDVVSSVLRIGNGITGARGYAQSAAPAQGFLTGSSQTLTFPDHDDENVVVNLPRPIDFFGIRYSQIAVGTNGWASFGAPALDYFDDESPTPAEVGEYYRGVFPYWADLDLFQDGDEVTDTSPGTVSVVTTQDAVAIQWMGIGFHNVADPVRNFQVVFFSDGRIRYDYPGSNDPVVPNPGSNDTDELVALSGGNGASTYTEIQRAAHAVPGGSILFTPSGLGKTGTAPKGTATAQIPAGATFFPASTDPRCSLTTAPTDAVPGLATCATPVLNKGVGDAFQVSWTVPPTQPDLSFAGTYHADGFSLTDAEQLLLDTH